MAKPTRLIDPTAKAWKDWMWGISFFFGFLTLGAFGNESVEGVLIFAGLTVLFGWIASKIKTEYKLVGHIRVYKK